MFYWHYVPQFLWAYWNYSALLFWTRVQRGFISKLLPIGSAGLLSLCTNSSVFFTSLSQLLPLALIKEVLFCHCRWGHCKGDLEGSYVYERSSYSYVKVIKLWPVWEEQECICSSRSLSFAQGCVPSWVSAFCFVNLHLEQTV